MANVAGRGKPKSNFDVPEGADTFKVTKFEAVPRANPNLVNATFVNSDGGTVTNKYDLDSDGGYAAFYNFMLYGYDVDLSEDNVVVNTDDIVDTFVELEIVHKPREKGGVFNNVKATIGPGEPFGDGTTDAAPVEGDEDWED